jgi:hypothetical protein
MILYWIVKPGAYTNYQFKPGDPHSLSNNVVQSLCRQIGQYVDWHMAGLNLFDPVHKNFRRFHTKKDVFRGIAFIIASFL